MVGRMRGRDWKIFIGSLKLHTRDSMGNSINAPDLLQYSDLQVKSLLLQIPLEIFPEVVLLRDNDWCAWEVLLPWVTLAQYPPGFFEVFILNYARRTSISARRHKVPGHG